MGLHLGNGQDERLEICEMQQVKSIVSQAKPPPTKEACKLHRESKHIHIGAAHL